MKRFLQEACKNCEDNNKSLMFCIGTCSIPCDILTQIEENRKKREENIEIPGQIKVEFDILK